MNEQKIITHIIILKKTFLRLLRFPLPETILMEIKKEYADVLVKSGDPVTALKIIEEIPEEDSHFFNELMAKKSYLHDKYRQDRIWSYSSS